MSEQFLKLTQDDGEPLFVRPERVIAVWSEVDPATRPVGHASTGRQENRTTFVSTDDVRYDVTESAEDIVKQIDGWEW